MTRRIIILTEGETSPITAKTGVSVIRYKPHEVVAVLDSTHAGQTAGAVLGVGGEIPVVASVEQAPAADTLLIGIAPAGGNAAGGGKKGGGDGPRQPDPLQTSVGYIGADAFHRKGGRGGGNRGGGNQGGR